MPTSRSNLRKIYLRYETLLKKCCMFVNKFCLVILGRNSEIEHKDKDLVFINYTFKRFEGLTQRGMLKMNNTSSWLREWQLCVKPAQLLALPAFSSAMFEVPWQQLPISSTNYVEIIVYISAGNFFGKALQQWTYEWLRHAF